MDFDFQFEKICGIIVALLKIRIITINVRFAFIVTNMVLKKISAYFL